jgi:hypothetical protein
MIFSNAELKILESFGNRIKRYKKTRWIELIFCLGLIAAYIANNFYNFLEDNLASLWMIIGASGIGVLCSRWNGTREQRFIVRILNKINQENANQSLDRTQNGAIFTNNKLNLNKEKTESNAVT